MTGFDDQSDRAKAREALIGRTVAGRYAIRGLLGAGGMGAVYEAEHLDLGKAVAIKFVDPEFATDEQVVARFAREARVMSRLDSAHVVTIFDAGNEGGRPFLVMELLRGEDLGNRLRRKRTVPREEALHIVAQVLKGLSRAHAAGIIHRDLKPDNVFLLEKDGDTSFAKIVDFGVSKIDRPRAGTTPLALTGRGTVIGTPFYMSPEQAQAASDVDGRADLYSVGAILFECLTGRPPHTGESYEQVILSICMRDAPDVRAVDPSIPEDVAAFVARALARNKDARFPTAERMLAALHEIAPDERARVPLDPVTAGTMLSAGGVASGGAMTPEGPGVATRLGVGSLDEAPGSDARGAKTVTSVAGARDARASSPERAPKAAEERRVSSEASAGPPRARRGFDKSLIVTASLATLAGVGVTLGIIHLLAGREPPHVEPPVVETASSAVVVDASVTAAPLPEAHEAGAEAAEVPPAASVASPPPRTSATARAVATQASPPPPKPSAKKLDIQRDLPP